MTPSTIDTASLAFCPLYTIAKGAKQLPALYTNGEPVAWQPDTFQEIPFEPSAYGDPEAIRVTLCVTPSEQLIESVELLDAWCIAQLIANPALLGIALTPAQVSERYSSSLKTSEKGYKSLRLKMNKSGRYGLKCFDSEHEKCPHPETWCDVSVRPRIVWKGLWIMNKEFGALFECSHALIQEGTNDVCPF